MEVATDSASYARSGAIAGAVSAFAFTIIHDLLISDIWSTAAIMMVAGALCGLCIGRSYALLVERASIRSWLGYNFLYVAMLMLLGAASTLAFEPIVSMAALTALDGPPHELIGRALPMTLLFTLGAAVAISRCYRRGRRHFGAILLTTAVLVLLLGLNVSVLGLVSIPRGGFTLVAEFLGLIVAINLVFVLAFIALEGRAMRAPSRVARKGSMQVEKGA